MYACRVLLHGRKPAERKAQRVMIEQGVDARSEAGKERRGTFEIRPQVLLAIVVVVGWRGWGEGHDAECEM
jgi:hypothetical protein